MGSGVVTFKALESFGLRKFQFRRNSSSESHSGPSRRMAHLSVRLAQMKKLLVAMFALLLSACATYQDGYYGDGGVYYGDDDYYYADSDPGYIYTPRSYQRGYGYGSGYFGSGYGYGFSYRPYGFGYSPFARQSYPSRYAPTWYSGSRYSGYPRYRERSGYSGYRSQDNIPYRQSAPVGVPVDPGAGSLRGRTRGFEQGFVPGSNQFVPQQAPAERAGISDSLRPAQRDRPTMDSGAFSEPSPQFEQAPRARRSQGVGEFLEREEQ